MMRDSDVGERGVCSAGVDWKVSNPCSIVRDGDESAILEGRGGSAQGSRQDRGDFGLARVRCSACSEEFLVATRWCLDRTAVREAVIAEMVRRGTYQGADYVPVGSE